MKKIFLSFIFIAILILMPNIVFGNTDTLPDAVDGVITLTEDVTLSKKLTITSDVKINLAGNKLTFTQGDNHLNAKVTIENGTIDITGVNHSGDGIIEVGDRGGIIGNLTFNNVTFTGNGYNSAWAVINLYKESTLNINDSTMTLNDERNTSGGVIKAEHITNKINIKNSTLDFTDTVRGLINGTVLIKDSKVTIMGTELDGGLNNGINSGSGNLALTLDNTTLNIANATGRGITLEESTLTSKNASKITISNCNEGEILIRTSGEIDSDGRSYIDATISLENPNTDTLSVSGGVFSSPVDEKYLAEGCIRKKLDNGDSIILKKNKITVKYNNEGGSVRVSASEAYVDDSITLTVDVNKGYKIGKIELIGLETGSIKTIEDDQFIMPNEPVTVNVVFENDKQEDDKQEDNKQEDDKQEDNKQEDNKQEDDKQEDNKQEDDKQEDDKQEDNKQEDDKQEDNKQEDDKQEDDKQEDDKQEDNKQEDDKQEDDKQPEDTSIGNVESGPKTGDNIWGYVLLAIISIIGIIVSKLCKNKK